MPLLQGRDLMKGQVCACTSLELVALGGFMKCVFTCCKKCFPRQINNSHFLSLQDEGPGRRDGGRWGEKREKASSRLSHCRLENLAVLLQASAVFVDLELAEDGSQLTGMMEATFCSLPLF